MKTLTFFCLTFFLTLTLNAGTLLPASAIPDNDIEHEIELKGDMPSPKIRRVLPNPISANINLSLNIAFAYSIGNVSIEVSSDFGGNVYSLNVDTNLQKSLSLSVSELEAGTYHIRFVKSDGSFIYGSFEIY